MSKKQVLISPEFCDQKVETSSINKFKQLNSIGFEHNATFILPNFTDHDPNDMPSGHATTYLSKTKISDEIIKKNLCSQMMLFKIKNKNESGEVEELESFEFDKKIAASKEKLNEFLKQQNSKPEQNSCSLSHQKEENSMEDKAKWVSSLGEDGRIGVYKIERGHDDYDYYIFVNVGQTEASKQLYLQVMSKKNQEEQQTIKDFMNSGQYNYLCSVNKRNAKRLAHKAAKILDVYVEEEEDKFAYVDNPYEMKPKMAKAAIEMEYNTFVEATFHKQPSVFFYDNSVCLKKVKGGVIMMQNPILPLGVVFFDKNYNKKNLENEALFSFPISTGLNCNPESFEQIDDKKSLFTPKELSKIERKITWENKENVTGQFNYRTVSKLYKTLDKKNKTQQDILDRLNPSFSKHFKEARPLIVKISI